MSFLSGFRDNPALAREATMRHGQRRRRGAWPELWAWVGVVAALLLAAGSAWWLTRPDRNAWQSRTFVAALCAVYFLLVALLIPGPAAASISGERERETWQELLLTRLRPWQVRWHIGCPELCAHTSGAQSRNVGGPGVRELLRALAQVHCREIVAQLAILPRQIVVAINQWHLTQYLARQRKILSGWQGCRILGIRRDSHGENTQQDGQQLRPVAQWRTGSRIAPSQGRHDLEDEAE